MPRTTAATAPRSSPSTTAGPGSSHRQTDSSVARQPLGRAAPPSVRAARSATRSATPVLDQYSVCSATLAWMSLYSWLWVSGISDMSLPMFPATFIFPCMNAAFASSSPFRTRTESS